MTRIQLIAVASLLLVVGCAKQRHEPGVHYYAWAGLYTVPPTPSDPLSQDEATSREKNGTAYYIAEYDPKGQLRSLEKRLDHRTFFKMTFAYANGAITVTTTNAEGKVNVTEKKQ